MTFYIERLIKPPSKIKSEIFIISNDNYVKRNIDGFISYYSKHDDLKYFDPAPKQNENSRIVKSINAFNLMYCIHKRNNFINISKSIDSSYRFLTRLKTILSKVKELKIQDIDDDISEELNEIEIDTSSEVLHSNENSENEGSKSEKPKSQTLKNVKENEISKPEGHNEQTLKISESIPKNEHKITFMVKHKNIDMQFFYSLIWKFTDTIVFYEKDMHYMNYCVNLSFNTNSKYILHKFIDIENDEFINSISNMNEYISMHCHKNDFSNVEINNRVKNIEKITKYLLNDSTRIKNGVWAVVAVLSLLVIMNILVVFSMVFTIIFTS